MIRATFKILRMLVALALLAGGSLVLIKGGSSHQPPIHINWACSALGLVLMVTGALLARPSFFLPPKFKRG